MRGGLPRRAALPRGSCAAPAAYAELCSASREAGGARLRAERSGPSRLAGRRAGAPPGARLSLGGGAGRPGLGGRRASDGAYCRARAATSQGKACASSASERSSQSWLGVDGASHSMASPEWQPGVAQWLGLHRRRVVAAPAAGDAAFLLSAHKDNHAHHHSEHRVMNRLEAPRRFTLWGGHSVRASRRRRRRESLRERLASEKAVETHSVLSSARLERHSEVGVHPKLRSAHERSDACGRTWLACHIA